MSDKTAQERIAKFLERVAAMKEEVSAIFTPAPLKEIVLEEIKKVFGGRKSHTLDLSTKDREQVDKVFSASLKEGSLLLIQIDRDSPQQIIRRLEQVLDEGHISIGLSGNWIKVEPVEGWQAVVWVDSTQVTEEQFLLRDIITSKLMVG
jgi:hypothetical protein